MSMEQVNAFRQAIPELAKLRTACIMDGGPLTLARDFKALKVDILSTGKDHVSPDLVADCQRRGIQVWVWTVNSLHFMERLLVGGLCVGVPVLSVGHCCVLVMRAVVVLQSACCARCGRSPCHSHACASLPPPSR